MRISFQHEFASSSISNMNECQINVYAPLSLSHLFKIYCIYVKENSIKQYIRAQYLLQNNLVPLRISYFQREWRNMDLELSNALHFTINFVIPIKQWKLFVCVCMLPNCILIYQSPNKSVFIGSLIKTLNSVHEIVNSMDRYNHFFMYIFEENFCTLSAKLKIWKAWMTCFCIESWKQNDRLFCHKFLPARCWKLALFGPDWICVVCSKELWVPTLFCSLGYHLVLGPSFPALKATMLLKKGRLHFAPASDGKLTLWYNSNLTTSSEKFYWNVCTMG